MHFCSFDGTLSVTKIFLLLLLKEQLPRFFLIYAGEFKRFASMPSKAIATCDKRKNDAISKAAEIKEVR